MNHLPNCAGCNHTAWAHGNQSGFPSSTDPCHAAVLSDSDKLGLIESSSPAKPCNCIGYVNPDGDSVGDDKWSYEDACTYARIAVANGLHRTPPVVLQLLLQKIKELEG